MLNYLSHTQPKGQGMAACEEARAILLDVGARDLTDLRAASIYADTSDSQARHSLQIGKVAEAERLETEVYSYRRESAGASGRATCGRWRIARWRQTCSGAWRSAGTTTWPPPITRQGRP